MSFAGVFYRLVGTKQKPVLSCGSVYHSNPVLYLRACTVKLATNGFKHRMGIGFIWNL